MRQEALNLDCLEYGRIDICKAGISEKILLYLFRRLHTLTTACCCSVYPIGEIFFKKEIAAFLNYKEVCYLFFGRFSAFCYLIRSLK